MPRRFWALHATDKHWWVCFMLGHRPCWKSAHWDVMSPLRWYVPLLYALAARFIFREQPRALLLFSSQGPARKSQRGRGFQRPEKSELSPAVKISPVLFTRTDQHSSAAASDLVLFGGSNDGELDDSLSLVASDTEELAGLYNAPARRVMRHTLSEWSLIAAAVICRALLSSGDRYLPRACTLVSTWDQEGSIEGYRTARAVSCRTRTTPAIRLTGQDTGLSIPRKRRGSLRPDATPTVSVVCYPGHGLQKEGGLDRYLQLRLGGAVRRQTGLRPLDEEGRLPSHQLPGNAGSMVGPLPLSARPEGTSHLNQFGQYDGGVLHKSPGRSFPEVPLYPKVPRWEQRMCRANWTWE